MREQEKGNFEEVLRTRNIVSEFPNPEYWNQELADQILVTEEAYLNFKEELSPGELKQLSDGTPIWDLSGLPRGTHKIYLALHLAGLYYTKAHEFLDKDKKTPFEEPVLISSGNAADSVSWLFKELKLPIHPKFLVDSNTEKVILNHLAAQNSSVYTAELGIKELTREEICLLANADAKNSIELTSIGTQFTFPDVQKMQLQYLYRPVSAGVLNELEVFTQGKGRVYVPAGSLALWEDIVRRGSSYHEASIIGVKPSNANSLARMLTAKHLPFKALDERYLSEISWRGKELNIIQVPESYIIQAHNILNAEGINAGYSGAAGYAGKLYEEQSGFVVNTGLGEVEKILMKQNK